jgi:phosphopantothenate synthetase
MTDINDNIIKTFKGVMITMKELKISQNKLKNIIENKKLYQQKYYFKYK